MPCLIWLTSWLRPAVFPMHTPQPPRPLISTSEKATFQEPGNRSGASPSTHISEKGFTDADTAQVPRIELNEDDTINL